MLRWFFPVFFLLLSGCDSVSKVSSNSKPVSHKVWDSLLKKHVRENGLVDYQGFMEDSSTLQAYLDTLRRHHPNNRYWSRNEQIAYWINAYNAFTIELILRHYPVKSIKGIVSGPSIPFVNSPWDIKFIEIGGQEYDLNNIEHGILRERFAEPRIHFAINCASVSCPKLRKEAYNADRLNEQLNEQARIFINNPSKNKLSQNSVSISKIFKWFSGDFTENGTIIDYLNQYANNEINERAKVKYMKYNWELNDIRQLMK